MCEGICYSKTLYVAKIINTVIKCSKHADCIGLMLLKELLCSESHTFVCILLFWFDCKALEIFLVDTWSSQIFEPKYFKETAICVRASTNACLVQTTAVRLRTLIAQTWTEGHLQLQIFNWEWRDVSAKV